MEVILIVMVIPHKPNSLIDFKFIWASMKQQVNIKYISYYRPTINNDI